MSDRSVDGLAELSSPLEMAESAGDDPDGPIGSVEELEDPVEETLDTDTTFELLKNQRRRDVLRFLKANGGHVTLGDVAEFVAGKENEIEPAQVTSKQRKRVYVALYQCHLPMMDRAGVIEFNRARGVLTEQPVAAQLEKYLADQLPVAERWSHYLTVTALGGLAYLFATLLLGPGSMISTLTVFGLIGAILALAVIDGREAIREDWTALLHSQYDWLTTRIGDLFVRLGDRLGGSGAA